MVTCHNKPGITGFRSKISDRGRERGALNVSLKNSLSPFPPLLPGRPAIQPKKITLTIRFPQETMVIGLLISHSCQFSANERLENPLIRSFRNKKMNSKHSLVTLSIPKFPQISKSGQISGKRTIQLKISEFPRGKSYGTEILGMNFPKIWVYLARFSSFSEMLLHFSNAQEISEN